jgi:hypothetical protein
MKAPISSLLLLGIAGYWIYFFVEYFQYLDTLSMLEKMYGKIPKGAIVNPFDQPSFWLWAGLSVIVGTFSLANVLSSDTEGNKDLKGAPEADTRIEPEVGGRTFGYSHIDATKAQAEELVRSTSGYSHISELKQQTSDALPSELKEQHHEPLESGLDLNTRITELEEELRLLKQLRVAELEDEMSKLKG